MKLAISLLCENPERKTGLTTLFHALIERSIAYAEDVEWIVYVGATQECLIDSPRVEIVRRFPANDETLKRLHADHFLVAEDAASRGADALLTTGFVPLNTAGLPIVMHMLSMQHLSDENQMGRLRRTYRGAVAKRGLQKADLIITNTDFAISQILSICPEAKDRILQSYEGLDHGDFRPKARVGEKKHLLDTYELKHGYLFWSSNFYPYKQAELLMEAYAKLDPELRKKMPLIMVGGGGWGGGLESALDRANEVGVLDDVRHLGWVPDEDIAPLFRQAHAFVLSSREETFGRCVIEAMACGVPCVVNDIPVMHEVTDGEAIIVDFHDRDASAQALEKIATDEKLRTRLIKGGLRRAADFDFDVLAAERIDGIRAMLAERTGKAQA